MNLDQARERIAEHAGYGAFLSVEERPAAQLGDGDVVAVKDVIDVQGFRTTAGASPPLDWPGSAPGGATHDAAAVDRLRKQGCVIVGKTNLHEFCLGGTGENPHYGDTRNPRDPERIAGGSSSGSAAAVGLGLVDWALGTDTSGSVRSPAGLCGVVGMKPTTGLIDTTGTFPFSSTQDTIGVLAPDVATTARAMGLLAGIDPADRIRSPKLAVPWGWCEGLGPQVTTVWESVAAGLPGIELPDVAAMRAAGTAIVLTEAAAVHRRRYAEVPESYGDDVRELLGMALQVPRTDYLRALRDAAVFRVALEEALRDWDAVLLPTTRITATRLGEPVSRADLTDLTRPVNVTGHPALSLPAPSDGLPVGIQVIGRHGADAQVLAVAAALEAAWR